LLYQQPLVPIHFSGNPEIIEILLRLQDDDGSALEAQCFLPAAERYRLMPALDRWVIGAALGTIRDNLVEPGEAQPLYAINLSGQSLGDSSFEDFVLDRIRQSQIPADVICF
jgi:EAL domain-containing protein (putative c-di-GMP-specific phosphodiesterase class I)